MRYLSPTFKELLFTLSITSLAPSFTVSVPPTLKSALTLPGLSGLYAESEYWGVPVCDTSSEGVMGVLRVATIVEPEPNVALPLTMEGPNKRTVGVSVLLTPTFRFPLSLPLT